jgi:ribosome maturation factor RimP
MDPRERAERAVEACLAEALPDVDLREVTIVPSGGDPMLRVVIDHPDGVDHDLCVAVTRALERAGLRDDHGIEVWSPGPEPPLRTTAHFRGAVGARVRLRVTEPDAPRGWRTRTGTLLDADADGITLGGDEGVRRIVFADVRKAHMLKGVAS